MDSSTHMQAATQLHSTLASRTAPSGATLASRTPATTATPTDPRRKRPHPAAPKPSHESTSNPPAALPAPPSAAANTQPPPAAPKAPRIPGAELHPLDRVAGDPSLLPQKHRFTLKTLTFSWQNLSLPCEAAFVKGHFSSVRKLFGVRFSCMPFTFVNGGPLGDALLGVLAQVATSLAGHYVVMGIIGTCETI
jgi:hypothetical protein